MRTIRALLRYRILGPMGVALLVIVAMPAIVGLLMRVLGLLHGASLPTWLLDVGHNSTGGGAAGGAGAAAAGASDPTKFKMPPWWPADSDSSSGKGQSGGGSGGPDQPPWWQKWIPSSWTNVPVAGPISFDVTTGRVGAGAGGTVGAPDLGIPSVGVSASANAGAAPGSDPGGPIVDLNYNVNVQTPVGNYGVSGTATVGINQQTQQNLSGGMGFQGSQSGAAAQNFANDPNQ